MAAETVTALSNLKPASFVSLAFLICFGSVAADAEDWAIAKSSPFQGIGFVVEAPTDWTINARGSNGEISIASPKIKTPNGLEVPAMLSFIQHELAIAPEVWIDRIHTSMTNEDKYYPAPHEVKEQKTANIFGEEAYFLNYIRSTHYCTKKTDQIHRFEETMYWFALNPNHAVKVRFHSCSPEAYKKYLPTAQKIIEKASIGPWVPWTEETGESWKIFFSQELMPIFVRRDYVDEELLTFEYPPSFSLDVVSRMSASRQRETGQLIVDVLPDDEFSDSFVRIWIEGIPIDSGRGVDALFGRSEAEFVSRRLTSYTKSDVEKVHHPRVGYYSFDRNARFEGTRGVFRTTYSGANQQGVPYKIREDAFASIVVGYHIMIGAPEAKFDAFLERTRKLVSSIELYRKVPRASPI